VVPPSEPTHVIGRDAPTADRTSVTSRIRLFVFDLDGTLVDSQRDIANAANDVLQQCGATPLSEAAIAGMVGDGAALLIARAFKAANCPRPADVLERFLDAYHLRMLEHTRPYAGVPELLETLNTRGTLAVLTNKPIHATRAILEGCGLAGYFGSRVLGGDGPLPRKPDPAGLLSLMRDADVDAPASLMVGDSAADLRAARNAGTQVCIARYGFGYAGIPAGELLETDRIIDHPLQLAATL